MKYLILSIIGIGAALMSKAASAAGIKPVNVTKFDDIFKKYAAKYNIDWKLLKTISMVESNLGENPRVKRGIENPTDIKGSMSEDGKSWGIMQLTVTTAKDYDSTATEVKLNNPEYSINIAAQLISSLSRGFNENERDIVMAYNHGRGNQRRFNELERQGTLKNNQFPAARHYLSKFINYKKFLFPQ